MQDSIKPSIITSTYERPEGRRLQEVEFFRSLLEPITARISCNVTTIDRGSCTCPLPQRSLELRCREVR